MRRPDYKRQLVDYFKKNLSKNYPENSLRYALEAQGYSKVAISNALETAHKEMAKKAPILKEKPIIKYEVYDQENNPIKIEPLTFWEKVKNFFKGNKY